VSWGAAACLSLHLEVLLELLEETWPWRDGHGQRRRHAAR